MGWMVMRGGRGVSMTERGVGYFDALKPCGGSVRLARFTPRFRVPLYPMKIISASLLVASLCSVVSILPAAETVLPNVTYKPSEVFNLWPGTAPGETGNIGPE